MVQNHNNLYNIITDQQNIHHHHHHHQILVLILVLVLLLQFSSNQIHLSSILLKYASVLIDIHLVGSVVGQHSPSLSSRLWKIEYTPLV